MVETFQQTNAKKSMEKNIDAIIKKINPEDKEEVRKTLNELLNSRDPVRTNAYVQNILSSIASSDTDKMTLYRALFYEKDGTTERKSPFYHPNNLNMTFLGYLNSDDLRGTSDIALFPNMIKAAYLVTGTATPQKEQQIQPTKEEVPVLLTFDMGEIGPKFIDNIESHIKRISKTHDSIRNSVGSEKTSILDNKMKQLKTDADNVINYYKSKGNDFNMLYERYSRFVTSYFGYLDEFRRFSKIHNDKISEANKNFFLRTVALIGVTAISAKLAPGLRSIPEPKLLVGVTATAAISNVAWTFFDNWRFNYSGQIKSIDRNAISDIKDIRKNIAKLGESIEGDNSSKAKIMEKINEVEVQLDSDIKFFEDKLNSGEKITDREMQKLNVDLIKAAALTPLIALGGYLGVKMATKSFKGIKSWWSGGLESEAVSKEAAENLKKIKPLLPSAKDKIVSLMEKTTLPKGTEPEIVKEFEILKNKISKSNAKDLKTLTDQILGTEKTSGFEPLLASINRQKAKAFLQKVLDEYEAAFKKVDIDDEKLRITTRMKELTKEIKEEAGLVAGKKTDYKTIAMERIAKEKEEAIVAREMAKQKTLEDRALAEARKNLKKGKGKK